MATKAQLKQRCKELDEMLCEAWIERDEAKNLAEARQNYIDELKSDNEQIRKWKNDHQTRETFFRACLQKIRYVIAMDIVDDGTHRSRNENYRHWFRMIALWLDTKTEYMTDMDDIPF